MYRVVVADDEPNVIDGLRIMVEWEKYGFEIIGSASNGAEALDMIRELKPDLAVLDIVMPELSGIEVAKKIKEEGIDCNAMILTAYPDADYARECLKYGVKHFVMKPFDTNEMHEALEDYKRILDKKSMTKQLYDERSPRTTDSHLIVAVKTKKHFLSPELLNMGYVYEHIEGVTSYAVVLNEEDNDKAAERFFNKVKENDKDAVGCYAAGNDLWQCHWNAMDSLFRILNVEPGKLYTVREHDTNKISASEFGIFADRLNESASFGDRNAINSVVNEFFYMLPNCGKPITYAKLFYAYVVMYYNREMLKINFSGGFKPADSNRFVGLSDFYSEVKNICKTMTEQMSAAKNDGNDSSFEIVEKYLHEHFREQIVIKDIAKMIYTSPGYVGSMFSKRMGVSIKEYIHGLRLEEAVRLMNTTDETISKIAYEVGYNNYNNFFLKFEKKFGIGPAEYKNLFGSSNEQKNT